MYYSFALIIFTGLIIFILSIGGIREMNVRMDISMQLSKAILGTNAFFPFGDNIERAKRSGVSYIAEPGGSIRDDVVIDTCNKYGIVMSFTGMRLFHH